MKRALALTALLLWWPFVAAAAGPPPAPSSFVTDAPGVLSAAARARLEGRLAAHERATGQQVLLWIGQDAGGRSIEDFAAGAFAAWRVGRRGLDDGVVVFVLARERSLRIEVGYGLEPRLTDAASGRILGEVMVPALQRGDWDGSAEAGVAAVLAVLAGDAGPDGGPRVRPGVPEGLSWIHLVLGGLAALLFLAFLVRHPALALSLLLLEAIGRIASALGAHFPLADAVNPNELSDEIDGGDQLKP
jgi:uncharacterized protein